MVLIAVVVDVKLILGQQWHQQGRLASLLFLEHQQIHHPQYQVQHPLPPEDHQPYINPTALVCRTIRQGCSRALVCCTNSDCTGSARRKVKITFHGMIKIA